MEGVTRLRALRADGRRNKKKPTDASKGRVEAGSHLKRHKDVTDDTVKALLVASGGSGRGADTYDKSRRVTEFDPKRSAVRPHTGHSRTQGNLASDPRLRRTHSGMPAARNALM
jgi:hypothetical protein